MRDPMVAQLTQGIAAEKLALTIGLGLAGGLFPVLGFATPLCFLLAFSFRLNQPAIHIVNQLLWPVHLPMIALYAKLGALLYGAPVLPFDPEFIARIFVESPGQFWTQFGLLALHAITTWLLSVPLLIASGYYASLPLVRRLAAQFNPPGAQ